MRTERTFPFYSFEVGLDGAVVVEVATEVVVVTMAVTVVVIAVAGTVAAVAVAVGSGGVVVAVVVVVVVGGGGGGVAVVAVAGTIVAVICAVVMDVDSTFDTLEELPFVGESAAQIIAGVVGIGGNWRSTNLRKRASASRWWLIVTSRWWWIGTPRRGRGAAGLGEGSAGGVGKWTPCVGYR